MRAPSRATLVCAYRACLSFQNTELERVRMDFVLTCVNAIFSYDIFYGKLVETIKVAVHAFYNDESFNTEITPVRCVLIVVIILIYIDYVLVIMLKTISIVLSPYSFN